jgi:hypothetical protein
MYTPGIRIKSISELGFTICSAMDKHEEYTNILEVKTTYSDRGGQNPEESDYFGA